MNNNQKKAINFALIGAIITGGAALTTGCDKGDEFSIIWNEELSNTLQLQPGESLLLYAARDDEKAGNISYVITEGSAYATINNAGVLTVTKAAPVGSKIKVQAVSDDVKSKEIVIDVVAVKEIELTTTASSTTLERGDTATLNVKYKNSTDTVKDVTYKITEGSTYATLNGNVLTIKSDAADDATVTVMAETPITSTNTLTFKVNVPEAVTKYVIDANSTVELDSTSTNTTVAIAPKVYDISSLMQEVQVQPTDFTYQVTSGEEYVEVDENGYLSAKGHGEATILISYETSDPLITPATKTVTVNAIVPAETITLGDMFTYYQANQGKNAKLGFGINSKNNDASKLNLGLVGGHTTTTRFADSYKVTVYEGNEEKTGYATYNNADKSLTFSDAAKNKTLRIVVSTDTGARKETKVEFTIDVNDGINVYNGTDLKNNRTGTNVVINLLGDCVYQGNSNSVDNGGGIESYSLNYYGDTTIYGNGHKIDFTGVTNSYTGGGSHFLHISNMDINNNNVNARDIDVKLYDLNLYGNNGFNMKYEGDPATKPTKGSFDIAVQIEASTQDSVLDYIKTGQKRVYHAFTDINNLNINGFQTGMRLQFINSTPAESFTSAKTSKISNVVIENCLESGIETVASILTFENIKLGRLGTTGIETTPDIWWTAGKDFNQAQEITFKGSYESLNNNVFNNTYVSNDDDLSVLPTLINSIASGLHQDSVNIAGTNIEIAFEAFVVKNIKEKETTANGVNLISLLFNNVNIMKKITENPAEKAKYIRELSNGTVIKFEDLKGEATNINTQLELLTAAIGGNNISGAQALIMELFNSRFISLNVPTGEKVTSEIHAAITNLKNNNLISQAEYDYITTKLPVGADITLGQIIVENPLYGVYDADDFASIKNPVDLLNMIKTQTVTIG